MLCFRGLLVLTLVHSVGSQLELRKRQLNVSVSLSLPRVFAVLPSFADVLPLCSVQAAIEELTRRNPSMKSWQAKDGIMKGTFLQRGED